MDLLEYAPFMHLLLINYKMAEVQIEDEEQEPFELTPPEVKKTRKKQKSEDESYSGKAYSIFDFWKMKTGHKRSNLQDKHKRLIINRLKEGYTEFQLAHAVIGITFSNHHIENKYDHIYYIVRETSMLDRFISMAIREGITEEKAKEEYSELKRKISAGEEITYEKKVFVNPNTGKQLV